MAADNSRDEGSDNAENSSDTGNKAARFSSEHSSARSNSYVGRRSFMKVAGIAASAITTTGITSAVSGGATYQGITFDTVLDAVADLGMDDTGSDPIDATLDNALQSGTLIEFPPGDYLIAQSGTRVDNMNRFGIRGTGESHRDVRFVAESGLKTRVIDTGRGAGSFLIENLSFDERDDQNTQMSVKTSTTGGTIVRNVEWLGRTPEGESITGGDFYGETIACHVLDQDGVAVYENVVIGVDAPAYPAEYPNGTMGFRVGPAHDGEVVMRNCRIHNRNSSATRFTADNIGVVTMEGCEFVDNQNASMRFGAGTHPSKVSTATDCYVKISEGAREPAEAVRIGGRGGQSGAVLENVHIEWEKDNGRGAISVPSFGEHGSVTIRNCVVRNDGSGVPTINAQNVSTDDNAVTVEGCNFTGSGGGFIASDRPGSVIRDSCIDMPNASISGFDTENIDNSNCETPDGNTNELTSTISVTEKDGLTIDFSAEQSSNPDGELSSYEWDVNGTAYTGPTISHTFPEPGTYTVSLAVESDQGERKTTSTKVTVGFQNRLRVQGTGTSTQYSFEVSESLAPVGDTIESWDDVSETGATGWVTETTHADEFTFTGEITNFEFLEGDADVYLNGHQVDSIDELESTANRLRIQGTGTSTQYSFEVSESLAPVDDTIESWDDVSETGATGWVTETTHVDEFTFTGEITNFEFLEGDADVYLAGEQIDPEMFNLPNSISIDGSEVSGDTTYSLTVTGELRSVSQSTSSGGESSVSNGTAEGVVTDGVHKYLFDGDLRTFTFDGNAAVSFEDNDG